MWRNYSLGVINILNKPGFDLKIKTNALGLIATIFNIILAEKNNNDDINNYFLKAKKKSLENHH